MVKKSLEEVKRQNVALGFDPAVIQIAYANVNGQADKIIDEIFKLQQQSNSYPTKPGNPQDQDAQLSKAIQMSINEAKDNKISLQPLNPEQRVRKNGVPVGLKNIGNTCYFNSLLQTYFLNTAFVREILRYQIPQRFRNIGQKQLERLSQQNFQYKRKHASCKLVDNLKNLFALMIGSDRKYLDPTPVLSSIVDDYGNQLPVGDQKDIGQFNMIFLSRIDQGLSELYKKQKMQIQQPSSSQDKQNQSPSKVAIIGQQGAEFQGTTHSLLKNSSINLSQNSIVSQQFIGKISNSFHNQTSHFHKQEEQLFSLLFVNVKNKQLYKALEQVVISHIDDYRNDKGQVVGVQKRTWIKQAPKTLFFQIDRVTFDKESGTLRKMNDIFDFPRQFYIDPFLDKNKVQALQIQKNVKKLRQQKQKYTEYLNQLQNYGSKQGQNNNLLRSLKATYNFLQSQTNQMQIENNNQNPLQFPVLQNQINKTHIDLVNKYIQEVEKKQNYYKDKIVQIEKQIEKCYEQIRTEPYYLYSILVHEGSAQMGHYYSYIYDIESKIWRKYNDINISEQSQQQVLKEAKGVNVTSAYYLVYAQKQVLMPLSSFSPMRNHQMSTQQTYLKDYYANFLTSTIKEKIKSENHNMYYEIQQYKMGSYATRVVDSYVKKFQICNQTYRKNKPEKKKNTPPVLINLPTYIKTIDQVQYKNALVQHCIQQYGPKQYNPVFQEMLKKKMSNFNQFKRPKDIHSKQSFLQNFMEDIYHAIAARELFICIKQSRYNKIYSLLNETKSTDHNSYFNWLANLFSKIIVVHLLMLAEDQIPTNPEQGLQKLRIMAFILFNFVHLDDEKVLYNNCVYWMAEICLIFKDQQLGKQAQKISEMVSERKYNGEYDQGLAKENQNTMNEIKGSIQISEATWNLSRTQDVYIDSMLKSRQEVKDKIQAANQMYRQMKKVNLPLSKQERQRVKAKKK